MCAHARLPMWTINYFWLTHEFHFIHGVWLTKNVSFSIGTVALRTIMTNSMVKNLSEIKSRSVSQPLFKIPPMESYRPCLLNTAHVYTPYFLKANFNILSSTPKTKLFCHVLQLKFCTDFSSPPRVLHAAFISPILISVGLVFFYIQATFSPNFPYSEKKIKGGLRYHPGVCSCIRLCIPP